MAKMRSGAEMEWLQFSGCRGRPHGLVRCSILMKQKTSVEHPAQHYDLIRCNICIIIKLSTGKIGDKGIVTYHLIEILNKNRKQKKI
jgi:hypothetical protein